MKDYKLKLRNLLPSPTVMLSHYAPDSNIARSVTATDLPHLKIETRLIDEKFANAMGEYVTER